MKEVIGHRVKGVVGMRRMLWKGQLAVHNKNGSSSWPVKNANGACSDVTITNEVRKAVSVRSTFVLIMMVRTYVEYDASIILRL